MFGDFSHQVRVDGVICGASLVLTWAACMWFEAHCWENQSLCNRFPRFNSKMNRVLSILG